MTVWKKTVAVLAFAGLLTIAVTIGRQSNQHLAARKPVEVTFVSDTGEQLGSFFAGLHPVRAYVDRKLYPKHPDPAKGLRCASSDLLSRVAGWIGIHTVVHAQNGCEPFGCVGCYIRIETAICTGSCEEEGEYQYETTGGMCMGGVTNAGPACHVDNGCGCDQQNCVQSPAYCHCS